MPEKDKDVSTSEVEEAAEAVEPTAEAEVPVEPVAPEPDESEEASAPEPAAEPEPEPVAAEVAGEAKGVSDEAPTAEAEAEEAAEAAGAEPAEAAGAEVAAPKPKRKRLPRASRRQRPPATRAKAKARKPITRLPKPEHVRGRRQERQGTVVSAAADKTIVVRVDVVKVHPVYKKVIRRSTRLHAHDEHNQAKLGDVVRVVETRPLSRMKRWRLQEIVEVAR